MAAIGAEAMLMHTVLQEVTKKEKMEDGPERKCQQEKRWVFKWEATVTSGGEMTVMGGEAMLMHVVLHATTH